MLRSTATPTVSGAVLILLDLADGLSATMAKFNAILFSIVILATTAMFVALLALLALWRGPARFPKRVIMGLQHAVITPPHSRLAL